jgi:acetyl/propionyl-CoA carboxylase alpha subunit
MARYYVQLGDREYGFDLRQTEEATVVSSIHDGDGSHDDGTHVDFVPVLANPTTGVGLYSLIVEGKSYQLYVEQGESGLRMAIGRHRFDAHVMTEREWRLQKVAPRQPQQGGRVTIAAPMPGLVKAVNVAPGDEIAQGHKVVVLEAMKMENEIAAPRAGRVAEVHVAPGATVDGGKPLVTLE